MRTFFSTVERSLLASNSTSKMGIWQLYNNNAKILRQQYFFIATNSNWNQLLTTKSQKSSFTPCSSHQMNSSPDLLKYLSKFCFFFVHEAFHDRIKSGALVLNKNRTINKKNCIRLNFEASFCYFQVVNSNHFLSIVRLIIETVSRFISDNSRQHEEINYYGRKINVLCIQRALRKISWSVTSTNSYRLLFKKREFNNSSWKCVNNFIQRKHRTVSRNWQETNKMEQNVDKQTFYSV